MKRRTTSILFALLILLASIPVYAIQEDVEVPAFRNGAIIIQYDDTIDVKTKLSYEQELGLSLEKNLKKQGLGVYKIKDNKDLFKIIEKLNNKKGVVFAEPDYILTPTVLPDYYNLLWGLENSNDIDIDAPEAWTLTQGTSQVIVAVIDTGVQINHLDLVGQFVPGFDFYNDDNSVYDGLDDDHGTHVSGTIAALKNNGGIVGVAPLVKIMPLKFLGPDGGYTSDAIDAIYFARDNGADIINASWGGGGYSAALKNAIEAFGGPFVAAAGNSRTNTDRRPHYPSSYDSANIVSVAAVSSTGGRASFSNYGLNSVDVGAPGVDIASTYPRDDLSGFAYMSGTSMAAPHVAGTMALMMSYAPGLSTQEYIDALFSSVMPLDALSGKVATGGMINAYDALLALGSTPPPPPVDEVAPYVVSTPGDGLAIHADIEIFFNEDLLQADNFSSISISGLTASDFNSSVSGNKIILNPFSDLTYGTSYTVSLGDGTVQDAAGNLSSAYVFTFITETQPVQQPVTLDVVDYTLPADRARDVDSRNPILVEIHFKDTLQIVDVDWTKVKILDKNLVPVDYVNESIADYLVLTLPSNVVVPKMRYTITLEEGAFTTSDGYPSSSYTGVFTTGR